VSLIVKKAEIVPHKKVKDRKTEYFWDVTPSGFRLKLPEDDFAELNEVDHEWKMTAKLNGTNFSGIRSSLEIAFKVIDRLIWMNRKELWSKIRCGIVLNKFQGDLDVEQYDYSGLEIDRS
jgi:hypothetical protein